MLCLTEIIMRLRGRSTVCSVNCPADETSFPKNTKIIIGPKVHTLLKVLRFKTLCYQRPSYRVSLCLKAYLCLLNYYYHEKLY